MLRGRAGLGSAAAEFCKGLFLRGVFPLVPRVYLTTTRGGGQAEERMKIGGKTGEKGGNGAERGERIDAQGRFKV